VVPECKTQVFWIICLHEATGIEQFRVHEPNCEALYEAGRVPEIALLSAALSHRPNMYAATASLGTGEKHSWRIYSWRI
jgi:hypothetical protein